MAKTADDDANARQPVSPRPDADPLAGLEARTSEATRLMCAGVYLDDAFRDAVLEELYVHEERIAAPSLGFDATRVLAHALRARRLEVGWMAGLLGLWTLWLGVGTQAYVFSFAALSVLFLAADRVSDIGRQPFPGQDPRGSGRRGMRRAVATVLRVAGSLSFVLYVLAVLLSLSDADGSAWDFSWAAVVFPLLMAVVVGMRRLTTARLLAEDMSPAAFADPFRRDAAQDTTGLSRRVRRLRSLIAREQYSPLIMYDPQQPFLGSGTPLEPWTLTLELRPRAGLAQLPAPIDNSQILSRIVPLVSSLRGPAEPGTVTGAAVRDRLRALEIDECVFLPVTGLPSRESAPYDSGAFQQHRAQAVEEGGELRRHFLRVRVGAWREEVVITVYVRVHTQGGLLALEFAPHVLRPVRGDFRAADRISDQYRRSSGLSRVLGGIGQMPSEAARSVQFLLRQTAFSWRVMTGGHLGAMPEGPWVSIRELASDDSVSLFQEMDITRYLKSIQDRVVSGTKHALSESGWDTWAVDQQPAMVVNVTGDRTTVVSASPEGTEQRQPGSERVPSPPPHSWGAPPLPPSLPPPLTARPDSPPGPLDEAHKALLQAAGALWEEVAEVVAVPGVTALNDELTELRSEFRRTGQVTPDRLLRLLEVLQEARPFVERLSTTAALRTAVDRAIASAGFPPARRSGAERRPGGHGGVYQAGRDTHITGHTPPGPSTSSDDDEWPE